MRGMGMVRRFSNSLFRHWRSRQNKPQHKATTDFFTALNAGPALSPTAFVPSLRCKDLLGPPV
jgi:hypothetical protein